MLFAAILKHPPQPTRPQSARPEPAGQRPAQPSSSVGGAGKRSHLWRWVALSVVGLVAIGAGVTYGAYARDMQVARARLAADSQIVETRHGPLEYLAIGEGPPVLVVHGAGGGYDQGLQIARAFSGTGFRWIIPSRFGYLRTPMPADASTTAQAEAFADLLDALEIDQVGILAISGGVPPTLQFAQHFPERTSALVLLSSAPYTPLTSGDQKLPVPIWVYQALFGSDFPYWLLHKVAPHSLDTMFDVTPTLRAELTPEEEAMVTAMAASFQPVTWRVNGLNNEGAAINPQTKYRLEEIAIPTLVVHAEDDHINPYGIGEYTATHIRDAQFMPLVTGGHLLLGHHVQIQEIATTFLHQYAPVAQ